MADSNAQTLRQLHIKTGVVKRLFKEEQTYVAEMEEAQQNVHKLEESGADGADIRNAQRVVKDNEQMIPRTRKSLAAAVQALEDLVAALGSEAGVMESAEFGTAKKQLEEVRVAGEANEKS